MSSGNPSRDGKVTLVSFFIPEKRLARSGFAASDLPVSIEGYLASFPSFNGVYSWILQTHLRLKGRGFDCRLATRPPNDGIVVAYASSVKHNQVARSPRTLLVCVKADHPWQPNAELHVVQNPTEVRAPDTHYIGFWPQPGLIQRLASRKEAVKTVGFCGNKENLAPELQSGEFRERLRSMGMTLVTFLGDQHLMWRDYSEIDVVLAVRDFSDRRWDEKPANKLVNAWSAGVPAIVGRESAFQALWQSSLDGFEAGSVDDVVRALESLKNDPRLYADMVANGLRRSAEFTVEQVQSQWTSFFEEVATRRYQAKVTAF